MKQQRYQPNIFNELKAKDSNLLGLFNNTSNEILNVACQAPSPSKNYCQLLLTHTRIIYRWWEISLHSTSESRSPGEIENTFDQFINDHDDLQSNIISYIKSSYLKIFFSQYVKFVRVCIALQLRTQNFKSQNFGLHYTNASKLKNSPQKMNNQYQQMNNQLKSSRLFFM